MTKKMDDEMDKKLKKITEYFGIETELMKMSEEIGELQNECYKGHFVGGPSNIEDEVADVMVILLQIMLYFDADMEKVVDIIEGKIDRTIKRIEEGWYSKHR